MRVTAGVPLVMVPVLSNMIAFTLWAFSKGSAPLIRIPLVAPTPVPTMTAVGVARPRAHGQAIASTLRAQRKTNWRMISACVKSSTKQQTDEWVILF